MRRIEGALWVLVIAAFTTADVGLVAHPVEAAEIAGVVRMPEICSPAISPAVITLELADAAAAPSWTAPTNATGSRAEIALVNQRDLQFVPRVQVLRPGQTLRFANQDGETHNVHVVSPGFQFNQSMRPGHFEDFTPARPGVIRLACDIHMHMRGFVVVSPTRWAQVCGRDGRFQLNDVPDGRYVVAAWHEMGEPERVEVTIAGGKSVELPVINLTVRDTLSGAIGRGRSASAANRERPWADVLDRISLTLAAARDAAERPGELSKALRLADDAYWGEFESSDMETAIRRYLDYKKAGALERQFRAIRAAVRDVSQGRQPPGVLADLCHHWLLDLVSVARDLNAKGVIDGSQIESAGASLLAASEGSGQAAADEPAGDPKSLLAALRHALDRIESEAAAHGSESAAAELTSAYVTEFEPLERYLFGRDPQAVRPP